jgi:hypothetical protein
MRGRMIHDRHGNLQSQPYDRDGQVCLSVCPCIFSTILSLVDVDATVLCLFIFATSALILLIVLF